MREATDQYLVNRTKELLNEELKKTLLTDEDLAGFKRAALKRPLKIKWRHFLERETRLNIAAATVCLLIVISASGYLADFFFRIDKAPAAPLIINENGWQARHEQTHEREA